MNENITISKKTLKTIVSFAVIVLLLGVGWYWFRSPTTPQGTGAPKSPTQQASMEQSGETKPAAAGHAHGLPTARPPKAGSGPVRYAMTEEAKKLAEVQTQEVRRKKAEKILRTVGMVFDAETRVATLTARIEGRLDEVFIDFTGV